MEGNRKLSISGRSYRERFSFLFFFLLSFLLSHLTKKKPHFGHVEAAQPGLLGTVSALDRWHSYSFSLPFDGEQLSKHKSDNYIRNA